MSRSRSPAVFPGLVDLAANRFGGRVVATSDDFFAPVERLLAPEAAIFDPHRYTDRGKWMDGWESRRRRRPDDDQPAHDWAVVALGVAGDVRAVDIDTAHFLGNHPPYAAVDGCMAPSPSSEASRNWPWRPLLERSPLGAGRQNLFVTRQMDRGIDPSVDHIRLRIFPDGGVARLRVYGRPRPAVDESGLVDMAAMAHGGRGVACSDMFFGSMDNLLLPDRPRDMSEGWETRRRRGAGHDWVVIELSARSRLERVEIDTGCFKGNFPDRCSVDACDTEDVVDLLSCSDQDWWPLLAPTALAADTEHSFELTTGQLLDQRPISHLRLNVFPDGGVGRLRAFGRPVGAIG